VFFWGGTAGVLFWGHTAGVLFWGRTAGVLFWRRTAGVLFWGRTAVGLFWGHTAAAIDSGPFGGTTPSFSRVQRLIFKGGGLRPIDLEDERTISVRNTAQ
jgi:hypothetical protein